MIRAILLVLALGLLGACGPAEDCPPECIPLTTGSGFLLPCDPESGCPGPGEDPPPPPTAVRVDVSYENRSSSPVTTYAVAVARLSSVDPAGWQETREHAPNSGLFIPGVVTGEVGKEVRFSVTDTASGLPAIVTTIIPNTLRVHCRATLLGGGAMGVSCSDG
jgi:hypothetical protein